MSKPIPSQAERVKPAVFVGWSVDDVRRIMQASLSLSDALEQMGVDYSKRAAFYRFCDANSIPVRGLKKSVISVGSIEDEIADMKRDDAIEFLIERVKVLSSFNELQIGSLLCKGFSPQEAKLLSFMIERAGKLIAKQHIYEAVFFDMRDDAGPDSKTMAVVMSRVRAKIAEMKLPYDITTIRGVGFRLDLTEEASVLDSAEVSR